MSTPQPILGKAFSEPTQVRRPWRATARTVFAALVAIASMAPLVYESATHHDAAAAGGWAATGLAICGAVTRVLAVPAVNDFLGKFLPFLAAEPPSDKPLLGYGSGV